MADQKNHIIKTYMSFAFPVDPANVKTLVDLDISYALSTTLVDWNESRDLTEGLAKQIESKDPNELLLRLKTEARWSDGSPITATQVIKSINHAKDLHDEAMKGLFEIISSINAIDERTVSFKLNRPVVKSQILHKLTEPVYGLVYITENGRQDLSKSSGPYSLKKSSVDELVLGINQNWYGYDKNMAKEVIIRQPKPNLSTDEEGFAGDPWSNLTTSSSLMSSVSAENFKKEHYSIWNRNLDRLFFFSPSIKLRNSSGRQLFRYLNSKLDRTTLLKELDGYKLTNQFFPPGYVINDPEFKFITNENSIPDEFKKRPLQLLGPEGRVSKRLQKNIIDSVKAVTGISPEFRIVALNKISTALSEGNYDIAVLTVAVNDPNVEGPVSFLFGMNPPLIANSEGESGNFKERVVVARSLDEKERNSAYRKVFSEAIHSGAVLPLFHFSSIAIAREGIDLSKIPTTDETVSFSKVRFK